MEKYDVSIIVPVYNRENLIKPCIESINSQTYDKSKWEVIFVDDASEDKTIETIETLIDKNINYRILKRPIGSGNASAPRNEGIKASLGKYVFFLDSDDYVDSYLLENGMAMALKNDSDMVYFKMALGPRINTIRPFKNKIVDKADIQNNHLMRSLKVFKLYRREMLKENNILFDVTINVYEDMLFSCIALNYSKIISILADRDYYFASAHEEEHLSKKKMQIDKIFDVYFTSLQSLYCIDKDFENKSKFYNALLIRCCEHFRDISKKNKNSNLSDIFQLASSYFNIHKELFDLSQIYENEKILTLLFLAGDFKEFHKIANESKVLKTLQKNLEKEFKTENGFSKAWIFGNKVAVLDFNFTENKIAFDLEVDEKKSLLKVWMFSRNNQNSLEVLEKKALKIEQNKLLIFDNMLDKENEAIKKIKAYLKEVKNG